MALALFGSHEHHVANQLGPGSYHRHIALEDIEKFRELIEARAAQELAVFGQAHIVRQQVASLVALVGHGAELDELEDSLVLARTGLREEGITAHFNGTENGENEEQRTQTEDGRSRAKKVQNSFKEAGVHIA